eukprot:SAG31_NODE_1359_length_8639_cov_3.889813_8_plen_38_part_00
MSGRDWNFLKIGTGTKFSTAVLPLDYILLYEHASLRV